MTIMLHSIVMTFTTIYINFLANRHIIIHIIDKISMKDKKVVKKPIYGLVVHIFK